MSDQPIPPAVEQPTTIQRLREKGIHSVFDVVREGRAAFTARMANDTSEAEARQLYDLAMQRASGLTRLHTSLTVRDEPASRALPKLASGGSRERMGSLSIGDSGDYESWFGKAGLFPAPDSVASLFSPASYLVDLYRVAKKLHPEESVYHIDKRRPDLSGLPLTQLRMDTELRTLELVDGILAEGIEASTVGDKTADALVNEAIYPFGLPYDVRADEIGLGLSALGTDEERLASALGDLGQGGLRIGVKPATEHVREFTGEIVRARLGLSPGEYLLLVEPEHALDPGHWGGQAPTTAEELVEKSGCSLAEIHDVFASAPTHLDNQENSEPVTPFDYAATYLNKTISDGPISLDVNSPDDEPYGTLKDATDERLEALQRIVRLKRRISLSYEEIDWISWTRQEDDASLAPALRAIATYMGLRDRLDISVDAFVALSGIINPFTRTRRNSLLTDLFQPNFFAFANNDCDFGTDADVGWNTVPGRLAQGLGIDTLTLRKLACLVKNVPPAPKVMITQSWDFWAALYRLVEIPRHAGLSVEEGLSLWSCMESAPGDVVETLSLTAGDATLYDGAQHILLRTLAAADWLREHAIDIPTLMALVATKHRTTATTEILQFITNLHATSNTEDFASVKASEQELLEGQLARHVGAQFNLTAGVARAMIRWLDVVIDKMDADLAGYSSTLFWTESAITRRSSAPLSLDDILPRVVQYCHLLGQFALACHLTGLEEQDIALIVAPTDGASRLYEPAIPSLNLDTVFWLFNYTEWRDALPGSVAEARLCFGRNVATGVPDDPSYPLALFAQLNGWDPQLAIGVWTAMDHPATDTLDMRHVQQLVQWLSTARQLQLPAEKISAMRTLLASNDPASNSVQRASLSPAILAAVRAQASQSKLTTLTEQLAEHRRDALLRYYLHNVVPADLKQKIKTPDDLYEYMLIDAQVSARVTTSRIAEAISSVQLYLHRCREGIDPDVDPVALAAEMKPGGYFSFWDAYNKRYGTWAGLQRLLRYPASYVDPTLRYVKTTLFHTLEDALNQGRLTERRAEDAFIAYVDAIRDVLDIEYIDGHQIGKESDAPILFLGRRNESPARYFWRQTSPQTTEDAHAWSEWLPIDADIPTYDTPGEQPWIIYFSGAPNVVWWTWKTTSATSPPVASRPTGAVASPADNATLKEERQLYLNIATLRNDKTWRTRNYAIASTEPSLKDVRVSVYPDNGSDSIIFVAPRMSDPSLIGALRAVDRFFIDGTGPTEAIYLDASNTEYGRILHQRFVEARVPEESIPGADISSSRRSYEWFNITVKTDRAENGFVIDFYYGEKVVELNFGRMEAYIGKTLLFNQSLEGVTKANVRRTSGNATVSLKSRWCEMWPYWCLSKSLIEGSRYAYLTSPQGPTCNYLSSLVGPILQERVKEGINTLLSYTTQTKLIEPGPTGDINEPIRWGGGPGAYMWELFFHAPFLIACRLLDEQRFDEAEVWLRRIFSPSGYVDAEGNLETDDKGNVRYWNIVPLQEDTSWGPTAPAGTDDPDAVAMSDPMHYKLAVYQRWMQLYMNRGDMAYRQQTRDTMTEAKMWYVQASQLLGRRPYFHGVLPGFWTDPALGEATAKTNPALDTLDALVGDTDIVLPPTHMGQVRIVDGVFLPPVDEGTLVWWDRFAQRLYNLRHGLSLDGQPLSLPLYETPVSPRELQQRRLAADAGAGGFDPGTVTLPGFRFVVLLDRARTAVQQLMQFGSTLQGILERRDYDALNVLQQAQAVQIHELTGKAHALQIKALEHTAAGLQIARAQASDRQRHYASLASQFMNTAEIASMGMRTAAPLLLHGSVGATVTAAALDMVPNTWIAGMAAGVGGTTWSAVARAVAEGLTTEANVLEMTAGTLDMVAGFQRRREEWQLQSSQAALEVAQLDTQIAANTAAYGQALKQATHIDVEHGYAQAVLDTLTTRFTGKDLFNWQAGRVSTLYYQLYDATLSLCSWAQKAYQFETDDSSAFFQPGAWDDRYQGLLAGESLALGLQRLERAHLTWDQRALEVERTLSLSALAGESLGKLITAALGDTSMPPTESGKLTVGYEADILTLSFALNDAAIAEDYPSGMQLGKKRRIKSIAVTLPALLGPYEDIRAVLAYAGGNAAPGLPSGCTAVALSRGLADSGQFVLDFNDGKFLPFEGIPVDDTGTLSLRFPNSGPRKQDDMLRSITDVILHIRYTIRKDGAA